MSDPTTKALRAAERYLRYGDGQAQDLDGRVSRGREREPVTTHPSRGEALAAVEAALAALPEGAGTRSCLWHSDCNAADRALRPGIAPSHPPALPEGKEGGR